jgi:transposase InsO family protein
MPWRETDAMSERARFVIAVREHGMTVTAACREFGVSRPSGYKWLRRYDEGGVAALSERSRAPRSSPQATPEPVVTRLVELRQRFPDWGPKKLRAYLSALEPEIPWPAASTIGDLLMQRGLVEPRSARRRVPVLSTTPLSHADRPNALWSADFKGQFRLGCGQYCYPLTATDNFSRKLFACYALHGTDCAGTIPVFDRVFREEGLPDAIRTDNGPPFATTSLGGLSELSIWWLKLGIRHERIVPGHPEQNGRHERMHLTLKRATTRPAAFDSTEQQKRFDHFRHVFNEERPHEALDMKPPSSVHTKSERAYDGQALDPDYPNDDVVLRVRPNGQLQFGSKTLTLGKPLAGQLVGLLELDDDCWLVTFAGLELGIFRKGATHVESLETAGQHWRTNRF